MFFFFGFLQSCPRGREVVGVFLGCTCERHFSLGDDVGIATHLTFCLQPWQTRHSTWLIGYMNIMNMAQPKWPRKSKTAVFFTVHQGQVVVDLVGFPRCPGSSRLIAKAVKEKPMSFGSKFEVIMGRTMDSCPRNLGDTLLWTMFIISELELRSPSNTWGKGASKGTPISSKTAWLLAYIEDHRRVNVRSLNRTNNQGTAKHTNLCHETVLIYFCRHVLSNHRRRNLLWEPFASPLPVLPRDRNGSKDAIWLRWLMMTIMMTIMMVNHG